jgi:hypothetical protein
VSPSVDGDRAREPVGERLSSEKDMATTLAEDRIHPPVNPPVLGSGSRIAVYDRVARVAL